MILRVTLRIIHVNEDVLNYFNSTEHGEIIHCKYKVIILEMKSEYMDVRERK
jgi:hypothetical protein